MAGWPGYPHMQGGIRVVQCSVAAGQARPHCWAAAVGVLSQLAAGWQCGDSRHHVGSGEGRGGSGQARRGAMQGGHR